MTAIFLRTNRRSSVSKTLALSTPLTCADTACRMERGHGQAGAEPGTAYRLVDQVYGIAGPNTILWSGKFE